MLVDELAKNMQSGKQTDLILLDFSKAYDKVAHEKLLLKLLLRHKGNTLNSTKIFLIIELNQSYLVAQIPTISQYHQVSRKARFLAPCCFWLILMTFLIR